VSDDGIGIFPEHLARVFDAFESGHTDSTSVGLGLFVVSNLIKLMGGRLTVSSVVGEGTTSTIVLPKADPIREAAPADHAA
jgi:two-component system phosphate regulon sensor histidine kinase PhoR